MNMSDAIAGMILDMFDDDNPTIRIRRNDLASQLGCVPSSVGDSIDERSAKANIYNLNYQNLIDDKSAKILSAAVADSNFKELPQNTRDAVRARQFKKMLLAYIG